MLMKGISEIITMVLILMIVVALIGLAYVWFSGMFTNLTGTTEASVDTTTTAMSTSFRIEMTRNVTPTNVSVTIRNIGNAPINVSRMSAYISDTNYPILSSSSLTTPVSTGSVVTFNVSCPGNIEPKGKRLRIITETGLEQAATIA
jgi:flagellin-like protein